MISANPYLNFKGTTEEAFNFYKSVFGGEFTELVRFKDMEDGPKLSPEDSEKIMYIGLPVGGTLLMATDALESMGQKLSIGNNSYINLNTESKEESDRIFKALSEDGEIEMELEDTFWGAYFGSFKDKFGVQWMVNYEAKK